jgi:PAS domain S-box-containing protein
MKRQNRFFEVLKSLRNLVAIVFTCILILWTGFVLMSLMWELQAYHSSIQRMARETANMSIEKDLAYRSWAGSHGGVYVPITARTPPNPYLADILERDISTPSGRKLTLMNPAYITREVFDLESENSKMHPISHITSLHPIRHENYADSWETTTMQTFDQGAENGDTILTSNDKLYFRFMRPLITTQSCLQCHARQGYKEGDVRGGISITLPLEPIAASMQISTTSITKKHISLWLIGMSGIVLAWITIQRRTTRQERLQQKLKESEERFRSLYNNTTIGMYRTTPDGRILMTNPAGLRILGYDSFSELEKRNLENEGFESGDSRKEFRTLLEKDGFVRGFESKWKRIDGSGIIVHENAAAVRDSRGNVLYYDGTFEDVTERRQAEEALLESEERLRRLSSAAFEGIVFSEDGKIIDANEQLAHMLGYTLSELIGTFAVEFVAPESRDFILEKMRTGYEGTYEYFCLRKDGTIFPVEARGRMLMLQNRKVRVTAIRDITEKRALEQQIIQSQKLESIGTLAGGIAHDINNILQIISGHSHMLAARGMDHPKFEKSVQTIIQACDRGTATVKQILAFARKATVQQSLVRPNTLIDELAQMISGTFPRTVHILKNLEHPLPYVNIDATQMNQVLLNMCINAKDAMHGAGVLTISTHLASGTTLQERYPDAIGNDYVMISVADTGEGIDETTKERIFEPFFTTKDKGKGTGLGLSVAYGLVRQHNGFVDVVSSPGKGTTFQILLPAIEGEGPTEHVESRVDEHAPGGDETILVVEDEEELRALAKVQMEARGYTLLFASSGLEGLQTFIEHENDIRLVITDYGMPAMTGGDLLRAIRRKSKNVPIVILSGFLEPELSKQLLADGATDFVLKPVQMKTLLSKVRTILDNAKRQNV